MKKIPLPYGEAMSSTPLRGSTSPIHLHGNTWGCVVHDIIFCDLPNPSGLSYIHYWMEFRLEGEGATNNSIVFLSQPFFITHWGIEYVSGIHTDIPCHIAATAEATPIRLYFGIDDRIAMECTTTLHDLRIGKAVS